MSVAGRVVGCCPLRQKSILRSVGTSLCPTVFGPTPSNSLARIQSGYTLIEILIVLFIISIVSTTALLTIGQNQNRQLKTTAVQIRQMLILAEEHAMLQPAILGLRVDEHGFAFKIFQNEKKPAWLPVDEKTLAPHHLSDDIVLQLVQQTKQQTDAGAPQVVISSSGDLTPFKIYIGKQGAAPRYVVKGEADGTVVSRELP